MQPTRGWKEKAMYGARLARYAEIVGFTVWTVLVITQLAIDSDRFLTILVYVLHLMSVGGVLHFTQSTHQHVGTWFFLVAVAAGLVADTGSLVEQIIDVVHHGASAFGVAKIVLWSWGVSLDVIYVIWCAITYFRPQTPERRRLKL